ncbi:MAG TPA: MBL fold metallo-hydrolase, partial [Vicinamibacterales bacterium]|nr:MBL fold metallo-hydrolase [Vicinamibacterales bacterium]
MISGFGDLVISMPRVLAGLILALLPAMACGPAAEAPASVVRTADPYARGLTDADFPRVRQLADGVYSYEQLRSAGDERFTTVSLFVVTDDGVLVADGQGSVEETRRLVETIGTVTDQPIRHVVVCSDHGDHTAGNAAFPAGAAFYAHPASKAVLEASANREGRPADAPPIVIPTELVENQRTVVLGDTEVQLLFLGRAHTGGDLSVYLPREKILFMSEAYLNRVFPAMRSAYPREWVEAIRTAQAMDVDIYVPGHGFVDSPDVLKEELDTYRLALERVIAEATRLHAAGVPVEAALEQARFGDLDTWSLRTS